MLYPSDVNYYFSAVVFEGYIDYLISLETNGLDPLGEIRKFYPLKNSQKIEYLFKLLSSLDDDRYDEALNFLSSLPSRPDSSIGKYGF